MHQLITIAITIALSIVVVNYPKIRRKVMIPALILCILIYPFASNILWDSEDVQEARIDQELIMYKSEIIDKYMEVTDIKRKGHKKRHYTHYYIELQSPELEHPQTFEVLKSDYEKHNIGDYLILYYADGTFALDKSGLVANAVPLVHYVPIAIARGLFFANVFYALKKIWEVFAEVNLEE